MQFSLDGKSASGTGFLDAPSMSVGTMLRGPSGSRPLGAHGSSLAHGIEVHPKRLPGDQSFVLPSSNDNLVAAGRMFTNSNSVKRTHSNLQKIMMRDDHIRLMNQQHPFINSELKDMSGPLFDQAYPDGITGNYLPIMLNGLPLSVMDNQTLQRTANRTSMAPMLPPGSPLSIPLSPPQSGDVSMRPALQRFSRKSALQDSAFETVPEEGTNPRPRASLPARDSEVDIPEDEQSAVQEVPGKPKDDGTIDKPTTGQNQPQDTEAKTNAQNEEAGNITVRSKLRSPQTNTEPVFAPQSTGMLNELLDKGGTTSKNLSEAIKPVLRRIKLGGTGLPRADTAENMTPHIDGQPVAEKARELYDTSPLGRKMIKQQILSLTASQINIMLLHLARRGDYNALDILMKSHGLDPNLVDDEGRTALIYAAIGGHEKVLSLLFKRGTMLDLADYSGRTALHWACHYGRAGAARRLLKLRMGLLTLEDYHGKTCLHCATYAEKPDALAVILVKIQARRFKHRSQHELNRLDDEKMTPLMWATYHGNPQHVSMLLKSGANVYLKDIEGKTALHWVAGNKHTKCCSVLLRHSPDLVMVRDTHGRVPLHLACGYGNIAIVEKLLQEGGVDINIRDDRLRTPLHWASVSGRAACIKILCDYSANLDAVDQHGATALHYSAQENFADCMHILVKKGASVNAADEVGRTPLIWAAVQGHLDAMKVLVAANADVNAGDHTGLTALHVAAYAGETQCCLILIRNGAKVSAVDSKLHTPLYRAVIAGWTDVALTFVNEGADTNVRDVDGRYPLHWAASAGYLELVHLLINYGAKPDCVDYKGTQPIHEAAFQGRTDIVVYYLSRENRKDFVNARDSNGCTPLHWAAVDGHHETCRALLLYGADVNAMEYDEDTRSTPLDYAMENDQTYCIQLLRSFGGKTAEEKRHAAAKQSRLRKHHRNNKVAKGTRRKLGADVASSQRQREESHKKPTRKTKANNQHASSKQNDTPSPVDKEPPQATLSVSNATNNLLEIANKEQQQKEESLRLEWQKLEEERQKWMDDKKKAEEEIVHKEKMKEMKQKQEQEQQHQNLQKPSKPRLRDVAAAIIQDAWRKHRSKRDRSHKSDRAFVARGVRVLTEKTVTNDEASVAAVRLESADAEQAHVTPQDMLLSSATPSELRLEANHTVESLQKDELSLQVPTVATDVASQQDENRNSASNKSNSSQYPLVEGLTPGGSGLVIPFKEKQLLPLLPQSNVHTQMVAEIAPLALSDRDAPKVDQSSERTPLPDVVATNPGELETEGHEKKELKVVQESGSSLSISGLGVDEGHHNKSDSE
ncbi:Ankyrin repeat domain-containing protein 55 [Quaeritorhiza haematococci]|nr:Ankyrin repeat domain-containing protein 55 [Quaeritorhiza haematococci]